MTCREAAAVEVTFAAFRPGTAAAAAAAELVTSRSGHLVHSNSHVGGQHPHLQMWKLGDMEFRELPDMVTQAARLQKLT